MVSRGIGTSLEQAAARVGLVHHQLLAPGGRGLQQFRIVLHPFRLELLAKQDLRLCWDQVARELRVQQRVAPFRLFQFAVRAIF